MAGSKNSTNPMDRKKQAEYEKQMLATDLYSVFLKGTDRLVYPGSTGVPKDQAEQLARGLVADVEIRLVRPGIQT